MSSQASSMRSCASSCWPHRPSVISTVRSPSSTSKASPGEWAGSVDSTMVCGPAAAQRTAVAAAVVVLPTPPLPVNNRMRTGDPARSAGGGDVGPQLAQRGGDDARLGPALHERRERDRQIHPEVVGDVGAALDLGELVGAVEHPLEVTGDELPRQAVGSVAPVVRSEENK